MHRIYYAFTVDFCLSKNDSSTYISKFSTYQVSVTEKYIQLLQKPHPGTIFQGWVFHRTVNHLDIVLSYDSSQLHMKYLFSVLFNLEIYMAI